MKLFIYEDICGGGSDDLTLVRQLLPEGAAMLRALLQDFANLPSSSTLQLLTQWDSRLGQPRSLPDNHLIIKSVASAADAEQCFLETVADVDAVLIVAPEIDGRLQTLCNRVRQIGVRSLNCHEEAIHLCSDKLLLADHLATHKIRTIPTFNLSTFAEHPELFPESEVPESLVVVKPRDGAGSTGIRVLHRAGVLADCRDPSDKRIVQPFCHGVPHSVGCFVDSATQQLTAFPVCRQLLADETTLKYVGGIVLDAPQLTASARELLQKLVAHLPGLHGYVGVDLLLDDEGDWTVVEVNPRLTTSYIGYRACMSQNLAPLFFGCENSILLHAEQQVQFSAAGVLSESLQENR